ncbi:hypothetical protein Bca52824_074176 [Brassica carinata]|uniref:Uncharacterized protein n=1 Tax=Brassica carinata TaxID=52824 RepID=A0A8X7QBH1_BRACI|nr:hypothetical protein Bca52824_074176 [Brassica carinata]
MEEGVLDVEVIDLPVVSQSQVQNCSDCHWFHHMTECFVIIQSLLLRFPISNQSSFVASWYPIWTCLMLVKPH